jgi:RNA polymerase sigma-70 factor (ECF subfamily)
MQPSSPARAEPAASQGAFRTTHWTVVLAARQQDEPTAREALASLCMSYRYPLYAFVRRQGFAPHQAEDLTQARFSVRETVRL